MNLGSKMPGDHLHSLEESEDDVKVNNGQNLIFYEFKSVKEVPPPNFAGQFIKDLGLNDVTSLDQIKWCFDAKKIKELDKQKFVDELIKKDFFNDNKIRELFNDYAISIGSSEIVTKIHLEYFIKNNHDWFKLIFQVR